MLCFAKVDYTKMLARHKHSSLLCEIVSEDDGKKSFMTSHLAEEVFLSGRVGHLEELDLVLVVDGEGDGHLVQHVRLHHEGSGKLGRLDPRLVNLLNSKTLRFPEYVEQNFEQIVRRGNLVPML